MVDISAYDLPEMDVNNHPDTNVPQTEHESGTPLGWNNPTDELPMAMKPPGAARAKSLKGKKK